MQRLATLGKVADAHAGGAWAVAGAPGSNALLTGGVDGTVRLWRLHGRRKGEHSGDGHHHDDGSSGGRDGVEGHGWPQRAGHHDVPAVHTDERGDADDGEVDDDAPPIASVATHERAHRLAVVHAAMRGDIAATSSMDGTIRLWRCSSSSSGGGDGDHDHDHDHDVIAGDEEAQGAAATATSPSASAARSASPPLQQQRVLHTPHLENWGVALSDDGGTLATGGDTATAAWSAARDGSAATTAAAAARSDNGHGNGNALSPPAAQALIASCWSTESGARTQTFELPAATAFRFTMCVAFSSGAHQSNASMLFCGGNDGSVAAFDRETAQSQRFQAGGGLPLRALCHSEREADVLFAAGEDEVVSVLDLRAGEPASVLGAHGSGALHAVAVSERRPMLVVAGAADGRVRAWDRRTGECVYVCNEHDKAVWALTGAVGAGADRLCSVGDDGALVAYEA